MVGVKRGAPDQNLFDVHFNSNRLLGLCVYVLEVIVGRPRTWRPCFLLVLFARRLLSDEVGSAWLDYPLLRFTLLTESRVVELIPVLGQLHVVRSDGAQWVSGNGKELGIGGVPCSKEY